MYESPLPLVWHGTVTLPWTLSLMQSTLRIQYQTSDNLYPSENGKQIGQSWAFTARCDKHLTNNCRILVRFKYLANVKIQMFGKCFGYCVWQMYPKCWQMLIYKHLSNILENRHSALLLFSSLIQVASPCHSFKGEVQKEAIQTYIQWNRPCIQSRQG